MSVRLNKFHLRIPDEYKAYFEDGRQRMCSTVIKVQSSKTSGGYFVTDVDNKVRLSRICLRCLRTYKDLEWLYGS
jgi:hypothetical protein